LKALLNNIAEATSLLGRFAKFIERAIWQNSKARTLKLVRAARVKEAEAAAYRATHFCLFIGEHPTHGA
jgi:hypothetical protein